MKRKIVLALFVLFWVSACNFAPLQKMTPTPAAATPGLLQPSATESPAAEERTPASFSPTETTQAAVPVPADVDVSATTYLDDRSNPAAILYSIANALNRHEFLRAYSYWISPQQSLGSLDVFSNQFLDLSAAQVTIGNIYGEGAAGSLYYTAPAVFEVQNSDGSSRKFASCFVFRFPQPANYGAPPITPMNIQSGSLAALDTSLSVAEGLAGTCGEDYTALAAAGKSPVSPQLENLADLSPNNFIDNRSGAVEVVSSLFNAINRKEYVRAYSYWQNSAAVGPYADYAAGFADTGEIQAVFGSVIQDAGAGQWYYQVPVAQLVTTTTGGSQTFVGCFTLHVANPGMQTEVPFEPLGITKGHFTAVANGSQLPPLLATACQ